MDDLNTFLLKRKIHNKGDAYTHMSCDAPLGCFNISLEEKDHFIKLLAKSTESGHNAHIVEKIQDFSNIRIDLDFKYNIDVIKRKYTLQFIKKVVQLYNEAINKYITINDKDALKAFIMEKENIRRDNGLNKDGIHIVYPYCICDVNVQFLLREYVINTGKELFDTLGCINDINDIVDVAVIKKNGWLMYGCSKKNSAKPYMLTHIIDSDMNDLNIDNLNISDITNILSSRDHDINKRSYVKEEFKETLNEAPVKKVRCKKQRLQNLQNINIDDITELVNLLSEERAENYNTWIDVGICLHNINTGLLDTWKKFSKKSAKFKDDGTCDDKWNTFENNANGLSIGSLHHWAKIDNIFHTDSSTNPYNLFMKRSLNTDIMKSLTATTNDIALVIYKKYRYRFKCVCVKSHSWYEFKGHRWYRSTGGIELKKLIATDIVNLYISTGTYYSQLCINMIDDNENENENENNTNNNMDENLKKSKIFLDIATKIKDITYREKLFKESEILFYDDNFEMLLNNNRELLCCDNGVYDLKNNIFRDGKPDDYITISTNILYTPLEECDEQTLSEIKSFMSIVFINENVRNYVYILLSSILEGYNKDEKFYMLTGIGGNGKSKLVELVRHAIGDYASKLPVSFLTQKRSASNNANPEIMKLKYSRFVYADEPSESEQLNSGIIKEITGGDIISCRGLFKDQFEFKPQFKIFFSCNNLPKIPPDDGGLSRRICVIDFKSKFVENSKYDPTDPFCFVRDIKISEKLYDWKDTFLSLLISIYNQKYKITVLKEPDEVKNATLEYQKHNDIYTQFIEDTIVKAEDSILKIDETYKKFKDWWKEEFNNTKSPNRKDLRSILEKKYGRYGIGKNSGWKGYKLIVDENI